MDDPSSHSMLEEPPAKPLLVAGPCSAESRLQVLETAEALKALGVTHYRAALWKPRTRPGLFEGVGREGLAWLLEVKGLTGLRVGTEVCLPEQVDEARSAQLDFVWLGARTVSNPFMVEAIAEHLEGASQTVLIKNPISPDAPLWMGAIERVKSRGVAEVVAILRGCTPVYTKRMRNSPHWEMIEELRALYESRYGQAEYLPILLDPSHIAGRTDLLEAVCRTGMLYPIDGFMIESHRHPDQARTDASQQITPEQLAQLLHVLQYPSEDHETMLCPMRYQLHDLDEALMELLAERYKLTQTIGRYKTAHQLDIYQAEQRASVEAHYIEQAKRYGLDPEWAVRLYSLIHEYSLRSQRAADLSQCKWGQDARLLDTKQ